MELTNTNSTATASDSQNLPEEVRQLKGMIDSAADTLKLLSHPTRLLICCQLRFGEKSVGDLEQLLELKQPNLSRELGKLRDGRFVITRRKSKQVFYRLADTGIAALLDSICMIFLQNPEFLTYKTIETGSNPAPEAPPQLQNSHSSLPSDYSSEAIKGAK